MLQNLPANFYLQTPMPFFLIPFLFLFLSLQPDLSTANVTFNSSLTTNDNSFWPSPSGDFAFGFRKLNNSNLFLLAIWFNKIPDRTIVWNANGNSPAPAGSKVELTASKLVLTDPKGLVVWDAQPASAVSYGAMLDSGNFVLAGNDSTYIWQSFKNPTDTILPTQILDLGSKLISRVTESNYSKGRFRLYFTNGSLQLNPIAWPSDFQYDFYYSSRTYNPNPSEAGYQLVFNESANIYIVKMNGGISQIPSWDPINYTQDSYYRATLDFDGVFTQYSHQKNSSTNRGWWPVKSIPRDICTAIFQDMGSGACGYNSYCTIQENRKPTCDCPPGYVLVDPNNRHGGCKPTFLHECRVDDGSRDAEELFEIREFDSVNWPLNDYEKLVPYNQSECEKSCLHDCSCAVAIFDGRQCWKKRLPLSNGIFKMAGFAKVLFKVRRGAPPPDSPDVRNEKDRPVLLGVLLGSSAIGNVVLLSVTCLFLFRKKQSKIEKGVTEPSSFETNLRFFTYSELEKATDGFREELGRGSFGIVYRGVLKSDPEILIAVKKLDKLAHETEKEFRTEVNAIGKTHHKNLVRLLGYCDEGSNRLLVYEYMSYGTLANFLFSLPRPNWQQRVKIALGIARGLLYLHEECDVPIIHCDIKPQNILLDSNLSARISDFGLAKLLMSEQTRTHTMIRGTRGYVAPEWFKNVPITAKVDVYSFGVMLLEIISCRKSVVMEAAEEERAILTDWAYDCYVEGRIDLLVGGDDEMALEDKDRLEKWVVIGMWCIQEDPSRRPTMKLVMEMLEGFYQVPSFQPSVSQIATFGS